MDAVLRMSLTDEGSVYIQEIVHVKDDTVDLSEQWNKVYNS